MAGLSAGDDNLRLYNRTARAVASPRGRPLASGLRVPRPSVGHRHALPKARRRGEHHVFFSRRTGARGPGSQPHAIRVSARAVVLTLLTDREQTIRAKQTQYVEDSKDALLLQDTKKMVIASNRSCPALPNSARIRGALQVRNFRARWRGDPRDRSSRPTRRRPRAHKRLARASPATLGRAPHAVRHERAHRTL